MSQQPEPKTPRAPRPRDGRLSIAVLGAGPFVVVALEQWGQRQWLAVFLFALGALGPVAYIASQAYLSGRSSNSSRSRER